MAGELLLEVGVMFAALGAVTLVAARLDQSVIPFFIVVGMALGEFVLGRAGLPFVTESEFVSIGAELGIVFLLFFLGLEFPIDRLIERRGAIGRAGTIDLVVNFGVGLVLGWVLFGAALPAVLVAGVVYISSSAIITKSLLDLGWIANDEAGPMLGTLVFEDLVIAVYLAVASALVLGGGDLGTAAVSVAIAMGVILLLLALVFRGTPLFEWWIDTDSREFTLLRTVGVTVLIAGVALTLGVSEAVAAFFVGMAFSETDAVPALESVLEPLRDAFGAVFFFWIGLLTDPLALSAVAGPIALAVLVTAPAKVVSGYLGGLVYDLGPRRATRVGLAMTTRGEFSLVIAALVITGARAGTVPGDLARTINAFVVGYVLAMALLGTTLMRHSGPFERFAEARFGGDGR